MRAAAGASAGGLLLLATLLTLELAQPPPLMAQARGQQLPGALGTLLALPLKVLQEFETILIVGILGILDVLMVDQCSVCRVVERADQVIGYIAGTGDLPQRRHAGATIHTTTIRAAIHTRAITVATTVHTGP